MSAPDDRSAGFRHRPGPPPGACPNPAPPYAALGDVRSTADLSPGFLLGAVLVLVTGLVLLLGLS